MRRDRGATEQSSGIARGRIEGETDVEGLEDGELLESRALGRWPGDFRKSRIEEVKMALDTAPSVILVRVDCPSSGLRS